MCANCARVCICATLTDARTDTRGCLRVDGIPGPATLAHDRAVSGAGGAGFGITVRARACIHCTDKHVLSFRHSCVYIYSIFANFNLVRLTNRMCAACLVDICWYFLFVWHNRTADRSSHSHCPFFGVLGSQRRRPSDWPCHQ